MMNKLIALGIIVLTLPITLYLLPIPERLTEQPFSTVLYSEDGQLLAARIAADDQWRFPSVHQLPEKYITALLLFEDKRFYQHIGVDPIAVLRAIKTNIVNGKVVSGASTLTMQLARMISGNHPRTFLQKTKETLLALQLEMHYSKQDILQFYTTHAPFGGNNVGLAAANWRYFGHRLGNMTWSEAALFAVLPNAPATLSPGKNREKLLSKRNHLLDRLYKTKKLSAMELTLAKLEPLPDKPLALPNKAPHLLDTLTRQHPNTFFFESTIDAQLQRQVMTVAQHHMRRLRQDNVNNLSALVIDNTEQRVLAYLGNHSATHETVYAPALDIVQRPRSSGSLFKPFLFALMLQRGDLTPESLVLDIPSYYHGYSPENYDRSYRGAVTATEALIQSLNVPAVLLLQQYGVNLFKEDLQAAGLSTLFRIADNYGLTLILGGAETTLWDITNAYAGLAQSASGDSTFRQASLLQKSPSHTTEYPIKQGAAWLTLEALKQLKRPGIAAAWQQFSSSQHIAWKTGTSYGWRDGWAVGSNGRYTVGVWAGNANNEEGRKLTGTKAAAPVMLDIFRLLPQPPWPEKPAHALKTYSVCEQDAYLAAADCKTKRVDMPTGATLTAISPYHQRVHVDHNGQRVHAECESVANMTTVAYFVLPPVAEHYYQQHHSSYHFVPAWRHDCLKQQPLLAEGLPMELEYPVEGASIKIPVELNGQLGRIVLRAKHRQSSTTLHWHLNTEYLGETRYLHEKTIAVNAGWHQLILVDEKGYKLHRWFKVI